MNDGTIDYTPIHTVEPTGLPLRCQRCQGSNAHWTVDSTRMCHLCLMEVSALDEHFEIDLHHAVISPELLVVSPSLVRIRVFPTTCIAPICSLIEYVFDRYPIVTLETEFCLEFWRERGLGRSTRGLTFSGEGWYYVESMAAKCHAPVIKLARAPRGKMSGFMQNLNVYSERMRKFAEGEYAEEEASNG